MNEPIISPWLIYWAGRIDMIQAICCIVGFFVTIYAVFVALAAMTAFNNLVFYLRYLRRRDR